MDSISIDIDGTVSDFRTSKSGISCLKVNLVNSAGYLYNCCLLLITVIVFTIILFEFKEYVRALLIWVESQEQAIIYILFTVLFILASFPFMWGYTVLVFASGYVFGIVKGFFTVLFAANVGVVVAHFAMRIVNFKFPLTKFVQNDKIQAILSVISGPKAFRVAAFSRLTPVPFGLQNLAFAISIGVCLMAYVLTKARQELKKALYSSSYSQVA